MELAKPAIAGRLSILPTLALLVAGSTMVAGAWFGFMAWQVKTMPSGAISVVLLLAAPALAVAAILARNFGGATENAAALELIEQLERIDNSLRALRLARAHVYVCASYAVVLGICQATGLIDSRDFVWFLAGASTVAAVGYLPWTARQEGRLYERRDVCRRLLNERKAARVWLIK